MTKSQNYNNYNNKICNKISINNKVKYNNKNYSNK